MPKSSSHIEPAGLKRFEAAAYCGVSESHFDKLVKAGRMPAPRDLLGVRRWVRQELDAYLVASESSVEHLGGTSCDDAFGLR